MNNFQEAIAQEWLERIRKDSSPEGKRKLKKGLAEKYDLTMSMIEGIVRIMATQGLKRAITDSLGRDGSRWDPVDYDEMVDDHENRIKDLERRFEYLIEGVERVLEDGQTFAIHLQPLHTIGKHLGIRRAIRANKAPLIELIK